MSQPPTTLTARRSALALQALALMASTGYTIGRELAHALSGQGLPYRSCYQAVVTDLPALGWVTKETPKLYLHMTITLLRISDDGMALCKERQWPVVENEWSRMIAQHAGGEHQRHALGCLALAWQARKRGWGVKLVPGRRYINSQTWVEPDLEATASQGKVLFEFETRARNKTEKWRRWGNFRAWGVCTFTSFQRESLRRELERACLPGRAWLIDLETLMKDEHIGLLY